jgi:hypothetical protein
MKELAVLKWHKEGCYAVAFGEAMDLVTQLASHTVEAENSSNQQPAHEAPSRDAPQRSLAIVHQQRFQKIQQTHWLVAGSKDGKISLWDIY